MMTEEEAKTKWCPHSRVADYTNDNASSNRFCKQNGQLIQHHAYNCLGSACMAWRWIDAPMASVSKGYCGLAGKP